MRQLRRSMRILSTLLLCTFIFLTAWFGYTVYIQGGRWATNPYNTRMNAARNQNAMGNITDRTGITLAYTDEEGTRKYHSNKNARRALSQTVGDQMSMSGTGVETFHAGTLLGFSGSIIDRTWQYLTGSTPKGDDIRLTVDAQLTTYISENFSDDYEGAVCVINYKTGEILAMVSKPDYDPEKLATRQGSGVETSGSAYLNRCLQGQYTPGSAFKVVTTAAVLETIPDYASRTFVCEGTREIGDGRLTCASGRTSHGTINLLDAFVKSCNITFGGLAYEMGDQTLIRKAETMGFNYNFSFLDIVLYNSSIPSSISDISELAWTGAGQGKLQVTPMHMAMIAGAVANDGVMMEPNLIMQVTGVGGIPRIRQATGAFKTVMSAENARMVSSLMRRTVEDGTAKNAAVKGYTICGKTGSAETSDDKNVPTDAWFIGFVDDDEHPYAISVVVEKGGAGSDKASKLASKALKKAMDLGL